MGFLKTAAAIGAALSFNPVIDKVNAAEAVLSGTNRANVKSGGSLKRLRIDSIPLFYQHRYDRNTPIEEVAETISELIREGKVQRWGLCEVSANISDQEWRALETAVSAIPVAGARYNAEQQKQVGY